MKSLKCVRFSYFKKILLGGAVLAGMTGVATREVISQSVSWIKLQPIHRVLVGAQDYMANIGALDGTPTLGEVFYLSQEPTGGSLIYRLLSPARTDHMISRNCLPRLIGL